MILLPGSYSENSTELGLYHSTRKMVSHILRKRRTRPICAHAEIDLVLLYRWLIRCNCYDSSGIKYIFVTLQTGLRIQILQMCKVSFSLEITHHGCYLKGLNQWLRLSLRIFIVGQ